MLTYPKMFISVVSMTEFSYRYIIFSGIDGCGKSTQIKMLNTYLESVGINSKVVWLRSPHLFTSPLNFLCRILGMTTYDKENNLFFRDYSKSKIIRKIYPSLQYLDMVLYFTKIKLSRKRQGILLLDRFTLDTFVDIVLESSRQDLLGSKINHRFVNMIPQDSICFCYNISANDVIDRREELKHDIKLHEKEKLYESIHASFEPIVIDARQSPEVIQEMIIKYIRDGD